jgi:hypothetical protein
MPPSQIVGNWGHGADDAFLYSGGTYTNLTGPPGTTAIDAFGINASGQIVGAYVSNLPATPLPATLPLFATGLGALGLFGRRRKRRAQVVAA